MQYQVLSFLVTNYSGGTKKRIMIISLAWFLNKAAHFEEIPGNQSGDSTMQVLNSF